MEKNNLDRLFKEKFKDFSETPDERVWETIEASLDKKKKKRIVPIWWQLGGVAAAIALLLYFVNPFSTETNSLQPTVVDTEKEITPESPYELEIDQKDKAPINNKNTEVDQVADSDALKTTQEGASPDSKTQKRHTPRTTSVPTTQLASQEKNAEQEAIAATNLDNPKEMETPSITGNEMMELPSDGVAAINPGQEKELLPKDSKTPSKDLTQQAVEEETEVAIAAEESEKQSIYDAIKEQENLDKEVLKEAVTNRWSMGPSVAPVFFSAVGEGSPIHSNFASNSKSGKLNLSYGLTVTYNVSNKLSIRSGVHKVDYGYDTNDIVFTSSLTTSTNDLIDNISYSQTSRNLVVESKNTNNVTTASDAALNASQAQPLEGRMVQQLGYVEVPMELNYALLDRKFGINIIGGVSSLFLVDNAVSLESDNLVTEMGEANNANSVNFSTNIGVGFNYEISQKLQLNVEPIFKYQLNTFSQTAGQFRPYSVGVYSGLSFRF